MPLESDALRTRLRELRQLGLQLAEHLNHTADQVAVRGDCPDLELLEQLGRYRAEFQDLTSQIIIHPREDCSLETLSLASLEERMQRCDLTMRACEIAREVLSIRTRDDSNLQHLESIQSEASQLLTADGAQCSAEQLESFQLGHHPWIALLRMIREYESLTDADWSSLSRVIETDLGPPLAIAATRGRLKIMKERTTLSLVTGESGQETTHRPDLLVNESEPITIPIRNTFEVNAENPPSNDRSESSEIDSPTQDLTDTILPGADTNLAGLVTPDLPQSISVFDDIAPVSLKDRHRPPMVAKSSEPKSIQPDEKAGSLHPAKNVWKPAGDSSSIFDDTDDDDLIRRKSQTPRNTLLPDTPDPLEDRVPPLARQLLEQASFEESDSSSASLAARIFNGSESERLTLLPDLILHLIHEGRPSLAYHLARGLEARALTDHRFVPSWLIRTWTFGHALLFPRGQLAGLLQEDLHSIPRDAPHHDREWTLAMSLMVRAATLRPAIVAPTTRAAAVLRSFDLQENCVQLYNYCSRIGTYGERIQGVFPGLFKQTRENVPYADQLKSLRSDISRWSTQDDVIALRYEMASPLFQKTHWSLRSATCQRQAEVVREWRSWQIALRHGESLIEPVIEDRRADLNPVRAEVEEIASKLAVEGEGNNQFSHPGVRAYLRQAITFAQRWIGLHSGSTSGESSSYLPQAAVELRSEIEVRHEAVQQELRALAENCSSFEVRMAVACLLLSVQEVRDLVDPRAPTETREPDPRHLLHSELLKICDLRLGHDWEPVDDPHTVEDEILKFLCQPQPDWVAAFKVQLAHGNDLAAERILSMSFWNSEEHDALEEVLRQDRSRQKAEFLTHLADVRQLLADSVQLDILPDGERNGIESRLVRLQLSVNAEAGASSGIQELDRVRDSLMKRREREAERIRNRLRQLHGSSGRIEESRPNPQSPGKWIMDFDT